MGQKITEHPAADKWVELMRERDKVVHAYPHADPLFHRPATDAHEWEKYQTMQRARTRTIVGYQPDAPDRDLLTYCEKCRTLIVDITAHGVFHKRTTYLPNGELIRSYLCPTCAGWTGEA